MRQETLFPLSSFPKSFCISNHNAFEPGRHLIQGIGAGIIPANLDLTIVDEIIQVSSRTLSTSLDLKTMFLRVAVFFSDSGDW